GSCGRSGSGSSSGTGDACRTRSPRHRLSRGGSAMTGKATRELLPIAGGRETWQWLRSELAQRKLQSFLVVAVSAAAAAMALVPIYVFGVLVDRVREGAPTSTILTVVAIIASAAVVGGVFTGYASYLV